MKKFYYLWVLLALPISGCLEMDLKEVYVDAPISEFQHACTVGKLGGIDISCEKLMEGPNNGTPSGLLYLPGTTSSSDPKVQCKDQKCYLEVPGATMDSISAKPALIVALEPGTYQANLTIPDTGIVDFYKNLAEPKDPLMAKVAQPLIPHLRVVVFNFMKAALEQTFLASNTQKYDRIYVVAETAEIGTKKLFLQTIDKATHLHPKVDLLVLGHGSPGGWTFSPNLSGINDYLTSSELIEFGTSLGDKRRDKIRSIFTTHCFQAAKPPSGGASMANALALAFPSSRSYGSIGINHYGFHRDLLAFDRYYQDDNPIEATRFSTAVAWGAKAIEKNLATGGSRTEVVFSKIMVKGEGEPARGPGWLRKRLRKTQIIEAPVPPYPAKFNNMVASYPFIFEGAKISGLNVQMTPVSYQNGTLLTYIPKENWPTVNKPPPPPPSTPAVSVYGSSSQAAPSVPSSMPAVVSTGWSNSPAELLSETSAIRQNLIVFQQQEADQREAEAAKTSPENKPPTKPSESLTSYAPALDCHYYGDKILDGKYEILAYGNNKEPWIIVCNNGSISLREPAALMSPKPETPTSPTPETKDCIYNGDKILDGKSEILPYGTNKELRIFVCDKGITKDGGPAPQTSAAR
jgi:hypothetical protein